MAGDGQIPLESKTGIDLMVNNHQAEYRWFYFIALPLRLYPGLKSNLAAGLSTSWTGSSDSPASLNDNKKTPTGWKQTSGNSVCLPPVIWNKADDSLACGTFSALARFFRWLWNDFGSLLSPAGVLIICNSLPHRHSGSHPWHEVIAPVCGRCDVIFQDSCKTLQRLRCRCAAFLQIRKTHRPPCGVLRNRHTQKKANACGGCVRSRRGVPRSLCWIDWCEFV